MALAIRFSARRARCLISCRRAAVIEIETHVREDHIHLYGFADARTGLVKLLTTVQGGTKVGLAILGVMGPDELMQVLAAADKAAVSRAPGVGPKAARYK